SLNDHPGEFMNYELTYSAVGEDNRRHTSNHDLLQVQLSRCVGIFAKWITINIKRFDFCADVFNVATKHETIRNPECLCLLSKHCFLATTTHNKSYVWNSGSS